MVSKAVSPRFIDSRFLILFAAGVVGVLTTLLLPLNLPPGIELPISETAVRLIGLAQNVVLVLITVALGQFFAPKVGLQAPVADALGRGRFGEIAWRSIGVPGLIWGVISALLIGGLAALLTPLLPEAFITAGEQSNPPVLVRLLYGGITEEILLRWGIMSFLAWAFWRLFQGGQGKLTATGAWLAIIGAAVLFGAGHLPTAAGLVAPAGLTPSLIAYIVGLNAIFGLGAGWLFWKRGLSAAIVAHITFHVVAVTGGWIAALF